MNIMVKSIGAYFASMTTCELTSLRDPMVPKDQQLGRFVSKKNPYSGAILRGNSFIGLQIGGKNK